MVTIKSKNGKYIVTHNGKWIYERKYDDKLSCFRCSVCNEDYLQISELPKFGYCPYCEAKMDSGEK